MINAKKMTVFPIMLIFYLVEFTYLESYIHKALVCIMIMKVRCSQCIQLISEPLTLIGAIPVWTRFNSLEHIQCGQSSQNKVRKYKKP